MGRDLPVAKQIELGERVPWVPGSWRGSCVPRTVQRPFVSARSAIVGRIA
jgi:hypothetical protein